jgi:hypothetical protein
MKHIRKFENFSNSMDFPDRLENECPECSQSECNCSSEQSDDKNDNEYPKTNYQRFDDQGNDWYGFDHPEELDEVPTNDDDNDGEDLPEIPGSDEEEGDEEYWGDENIQLENNLLMFKDFFINEKKKGKVNKGLQDFLDKKAGKKSKSKEDEEDENVKPDFLDLNKNGDKKEPMKKAAKEKEAKEKSSKK